MKILSLRKYQQVFFNQIMYEWEDDISNHYRIKIKKPNPISYYTSVLLDKCDMFHIFTRCIRQQNKNNYAFLMFPFAYRYFCPYSIIPIFLDTFEKYYDQIQTAIKDIDIAIFTNYEMYISQKAVFPEKNIFYLPLGMAQKWVSNNMPDKKIDVVQTGRYNPLLHEWMLRYCERNPSIEYVYRDSLESQEYYSTQKGKIGYFSTREEYMALLRSAKVSLVSTPGVDDKSRTGNYDFFTPRFYESACSFCQMIGRYPNNQEAKYLGIEDVCENVENYEEFESKLKKALDTELDKEKYINFTKKNMFLNRLEECGILEVLR